MTLVFKINTGLFYFKASCSVCLRGQSVESSATGRCYSLCRISRVVNKATGSSNLPTLSPPQTREQEELEELLLLEQQSNEQRRLEVLQEEQRQLQAKRKNKQALLDELVRCTLVAWPCACVMTNLVMQLASNIMTDVPCRMCTSSALGFVDVRSLRAYYQSLCCGLHCSHSVIPKPIGSIVLSCRLWKLLFRQSGLLKDHHR